MSGVAAMNTRLLTIKDVAAALNCSRTTVWRKIKAGDIPAPLVICGLTRWKPEQIAALIDSTPAPVIAPVVRKRTRCAA
jgi:excisionase family DNA binding protein